MHIPCPQCRTPVEATSQDDLHCPACQHVFHPNASPATLSLAPHTNQTAATLGVASEPGPLPGSVPGYDLLEEVGRGGMGVVYKARQRTLGRIVALKMILSGVHAGDVELGRFLAEAESSARLQHPNIVQLFEIGEQNGLPFFSLEFVGGGGLDKKLNGTPLPDRDAAALVEVLARAIQHAHDHNVVHRDLKPGNVLLTDPTPPPPPRSGEGEPEAKPPLRFREGVGGGVVPKITDFGLAKKLDTQGLTRTGAIMGTPSYMAPEQASGKKDIGPAADIYSLGAILYELLTGRPPFRAATDMETILQVLDTEPVGVRRLNPQVPRDLETITLKCLRKEPARRYATARDLADDLGRFLHGDPVTARPVGRMERAVRWCRHNPAVAGLLAALLCAIAVGFAGVLWKWREAEAAHADALERAEREEVARVKAEESDRIQRGLKAEADDARTESDRQREQTLAQRRQFELTTYFGRVGLCDRYRQAGNIARAEELLDLCPGELYHWEWYHLRRMCRPERLRLPHSAEVHHILFRPRHAQLFSVTHESGALSEIAVTLWDARTGAALDGIVRGQNAVIHALACDRSGDRLAAVDDEGWLRVWKIQPRERLWQVRAHDGPARAVVFLEEVNCVLSAGDDGRLSIHDADTGKRLAHRPGYPGTPSAVAFSPHGHVAYAADWSADQPLGPRRRQLGVTLAALGRSPLAALSVAALTEPLDDRRQSVVLRRLGSARVHTLEGHTGVIHALAFSQDGSLIASAGEDRTVLVWNTTTGKVVAKLRGHYEAVLCLAFHPSGKTLAAGTRDRTIVVWNIDTGEVVHRLLSAANEVVGLSYDTEGDLLASSGKDKVVRVWDAREAGQGLRRAGQRFIAIRPDDQWYATADEWGSNVRLTRPSTGQVQLLAGHANMINAAAFSFDGQTLATASDDRTVYLWDVASGKRLRRLSHTAELDRVAFSRDGKWVAAGGRDQVVVVWEVATGALKWTSRRLPGQVRGLAFDRRGRLVTLSNAADSGQLTVWDIDTGGAELWYGHTNLVNDLAIDPSGERVASAGDDGWVIVWNIERGEKLFTLKGHEGAVHGVTFDSAGKRLVTAGDEVKLWDAASGLEIMTLPGSATAVSFGSAFLALLGQHGRAGTPGLLLYDGSPDRIRVIMREAGQTAAFDSSGTRLVTAGSDNQARIWDTATGRLLHRLVSHTELVRRAVFSPDDNWIATASEDHTISLWDATAGKLARTLEAHTDWVNAVSFSGDGKTLASGSYDGTARLWDTAIGKLLGTFEHGDRVLGVALSRDGRYLATAGDDHAVVIWEVASRRKLHTLAGHTDSVNAVVFDPQGAVLASASDDGTIRLWSVAQGKPLRELTGHTDQVRDVTFSRDGRRLASAGWDGTVGVWDVARGELRLSWRDNESGLRSVSFDAKERLAVAGHDLHVRVYDASAAGKK